MTIFNFRATSGYIADGAGETYVINDAYPVTRNSLTFGYDSTASTLFRDRDVALGSRFAGEHLFSNAVSNRRTFIYDSGAGVFDINLALGAYSGNGRHYLQIVSLDASNALVAVLATVSDASYTGTNLIDASGAQHTSIANWVANEAGIQVSVNGGATKLGFIFGAESGSYYTHLRTIEIVQSLINQPPVAPDDTFSISNNITNGATVGTYTATDDVAVTNYTITGSTLAINSSGLITIASNAGITAGVPIVETVTAYDGEGATDTATITVNVTVPKPTILSTTPINLGESFTVTVDSAVDLTTLTSIRAIYNDVDLGQGINITTNTIDFVAPSSGFQIGANYNLKLRIG